MGRCVKIPGKPPPVNIQLPGGVKLSSMTGATQMVPNVMDPFQSILDSAQPALGAVAPVFDIIDFLMKILDAGMLYSKVIGSVMGLFLPENPFTSMFHLPPLMDEDGNEVKFMGIGPTVPDFAGVAPELMDKVMGLVGSGLNLAGLVPQISVAVSVKDGVMTAMGLADAVMAQVNGVADVLASIQSADTGVEAFDSARSCSSDGAKQQLSAKLGPAANLVPMMSVLSKLAQAAAQPLPSVLFDLAKLAANTPDDGGMGMIPFPDEDTKTAFLDMIEDMTLTGMPIEIPDFSDLSNLGTMLKDMQESLGPVLEVIEIIQDVFDKLRQ